MKHFPYSHNKHCILVYIILVCCLCILLSCHSVPQQADDENTIPHFSPYPPDFHDETMQFQIDKTFPISSADADFSILPDNTISFIAYKGQAPLYFSIEQVEKFDLYINNIRIPTERLCSQARSYFDASIYIKNGRNTIYIAQIQAKTTLLSEGKAVKPSVRIRIPYPTIRFEPSDAALYSSPVFQLLDELITAEIKNGFPGAQLVIVKNGQLIKNTAYGVISTVDSYGMPLQESVPITEDTLFDIASNTKMYAVNFALQKLITEKRLFLSDTVHKFFPKFTDNKKDKIKGKSQITIFDLLTHQSGLPAGGAYFKKLQKMKKKEKNKKTNRQHTLDLLMETPLTYQPRSQLVYSDIHYMLLTFIIEKITGMPLDTYVVQHFYAPLGLSRICFKPLEQGFQLEEIAATQIDAKMSRNNSADTKKTLVHGVVHDEEAYYAMEQVSGHAGLFANAKNLAVLAQIMLNNGGYGTMRFFDPAIAGYFTAQQSPFSSMGLGWRRQGKQAYTWAFSPFASEYSFGHTGWTGTLTFVDPQEHLIVILLTNAKNTLPAKGSPARFEGDFYLIKKYGAILSLIYEAFHNPEIAQLDSMLMELAEKKYTMLLDIKAFNTSGYIGDLAAVMQTIQQRAVQSPRLQAFLQTETAHRITEAIANFQK